MQVVYGLFSSPRNQIARPGQSRDELKLGWGVIGDGLEEARLPFSHVGPLQINLNELEVQLKFDKARRYYNRMTDKEILRALVGLSIHYFWTDARYGQLGFDFARPNCLDNGGVTLTFNSTNIETSGRCRGMVERVDARSLTAHFADGSYFKIPRGAQISSGSESSPYFFAPEPVQ